MIDRPREPTEYTLTAEHVRDAIHRKKGEEAARFSGRRNRLPLRLLSE